MAALRRYHSFAGVTMPQTLLPVRRDVKIKIESAEKKKRGGPKWERQDKALTHVERNKQKRLEIEKNSLKKWDIKAREKDVEKKEDLNNFLRWIWKVQK